MRGRLFAVVGTGVLLRSVQTCLNKFFTFSFGDKWLKFWSRKCVDETRFRDNEEKDLSSSQDRQLICLSAINELGLETAIHLLDHHLSPKTSSSVPNETTVTMFGHPSQSSARGGVCYGRYQNLSAMLQNLGGLIGRKRAVKILEDALTAPSLEIVTHEINVLPTPPPPLMLGPGFAPSIQELSRILKDVVTEIVEEKFKIVQPCMEMLNQIFQILKPNLQYASREADHPKFPAKTCTSCIRSK